MSNGSSGDSNAPLILVMGILGLLVCQVFGVVAWVMGNSHREECRRLGRQPEQLAEVGRILGMVSVALLAFAIVAMFVGMALFGLTAASFGR